MHLPPWLSETNFQAFKDAYRDAIRYSEQYFIFEEMQFLTNYAKHIIETSNLGGNK